MQTTNTAAEHNQEQNPLMKTALHLLQQINDNDLPDVIWALRQYAREARETEAGTARA